MAEPVRYRPRTEQRRTARLYIKLSPDDLAWIRARAREAGVSMGHYVLSRVLPQPTGLDEDPSDAPEGAHQVTQPA